MLWGVECGGAEAPEVEHCDGVGGGGEGGDVVEVGGGDWVDGHFWCGFGGMVCGSEVVSNGDVDVDVESELDR